MDSPSQTSNIIYATKICLLGAIAILMFGLAVPIPIRALLEGVVMAAAVGAAAYGAYREQRFRLARIAFLALVALYVVLLIHSNLPSIRIGMEGIRYTLVAISGLILGFSLADTSDDTRTRPDIKLIPAISLLLLAGAALSLIIHIFLPGVETSFDRSADLSTASLGGQARMQGLLSGPFHVAMLATFLTLAGFWNLVRGLPIGLAFIAVGETCLLLSRVRSGLLSTIFGLLILVALLMLYRRRDVLLNHLSPRQLGGRVALIGILMLLIAIPSTIGIEGSGAGQDSGDGGGRGNAAISQLRNLPGDHRTASRVDAIKRALDLSIDSPITGWGPGASASGLKLDFVDNDKVHETPHNGALGLLVEAGIGALVLFLLITGSALLDFMRKIAARREIAMSGIAVAAAVPLITFWILGDGLAALPISLCLMLILGVFVADRYQHQSSNVA